MNQISPAYPPSLTDQVSIRIDGSPLTISQVAELGRRSGAIRIETDPGFDKRLNASVAIVNTAMDGQQKIYGVNTGFGGMADVVVPVEQAAASQKNLLAFLATGAGDPIDRRHVRTAMLLRANVLARGCSGIRPQIVRRLIRFLENDIVPIVRELGSIGASGDLVPLSTVARAITGQSDHCRVAVGDHVISTSEALQRLALAPIELRAKEGLALVNGISFSASIAAHCVDEVTNMLPVALASHGVMLSALQAKLDPFEDFVHESKPHPGQIWTAGIMRELLGSPATDVSSDGSLVQDRYSVRCLPQAFAPIVEGIARATRTIETEMNSVSDNPIIDVDQHRFHQTGNFLGQYIGMAMDDIRRYIGLMAKHLDVQIATLMTPEFSNGLPASIRGNEGRAYNMGMKGVQILCNSIMPLLTYHGNPLVEHSPTHAEQFNQNVNGLSWGSANLAWRSVSLFQHYLAATALISVQAADLRAKQSQGHFDGRQVLGPLSTKFYDSVYQCLGIRAGQHRPLVFDDQDHWIEDMLATLHHDLANRGGISKSISAIHDSFLATSFD